MADIHLNNIVVTEVIVAPDTRQDNVACEHLAWMQEEQLYKVKFAWSQFDRLPIACDHTRTTIKRDTTKGEDIPDIVPTAPEYGTHPRHQFFERECFRHIIIGPNVKPGNTIINLIFCC